MLTQELIRRLADPNTKLFARRQILNAEVKFMTDLLATMKVDVPEALFAEGTEQDAYYFHIGVFVGRFRPDDEIADTTIKATFDALPFEWMKKIMAHFLYEKAGA